MELDDIDILEVLKRRNIGSGNVKREVAQNLKALKGFISRNLKLLK